LDEGADAAPGPPREVDLTAEGDASPAGERPCCADVGSPAKRATVDDFFSAGVSEAPQSDYATVRTRDETGRLLEYVELQGHRSRRPDSPDMIVIAVDDDTGCDTGCIGL